MTGVEDPAAPAIETLSSGPFKFLDYYEETDQGIFAGRETDIKEVVARIAVDRTFVLYGRSGLGKTSLLLAGVFPALRGRSFQPVHIRTLEHPLDDLRRSIGRVFNIPVPAADDLVAVLDELDERGVVVLVFDQFEEFFVRFRDAPEVRNELVRAIAELAANTGLKVRLVFSLREDYLAEMDDLQKETPGLLGNSYRLQPLTAFGTHQAIAQPLSSAGVEYERRLLVALVDLLAEVGFDPVMLQIVCTEVYRQAVRRDSAHLRLTEADLRSVGGLQEITRRYLDRVMKEVPAGSILPSRHILDALMTPERTKRAATIPMLVDSEVSGSQTEIQAILDLFVRHRLVRRDLRGAASWYELSHERLIPAVDRWLGLDSSFHDFRVVRDLVTSTCRGELWRNTPGTLLQKAALDKHVARFKERLRLSELELEFVLWSVICARTDVDYWIKRCGVEKARHAIFRLLALEDPQARAGAAAAAAALDDPAGDVAKKLVDVALEDPDKEVRRAAGGALAMLALQHPERENSSQQQIAAAAAEKSTRPAALELLADLAPARARPRVGLSTRWTVARIVRNRVLARHEEAIRARKRQGTFIGIAAAMGWLVTVGSIFLRFATWTSGLDVVDINWAFGWASPVALVLGWFIGWRLARHAARRAALDGEGRWWWVLLRARAHYYAIVLVAAVALLEVAFGPLTLPGWAIYTAGAFAVALMLHGGVIATVATAESTVRSNVSEAEVWGWSFIASVGLPILGPALAVTAWANRGSPARIDGDTALQTACAAAILISFLSFVAMVTLARTASGRPINALRAPTRRGRMIGRGIGIASVVGVSVWYASTFGIHSIPLFPEEVALDPEQKRTATLRLHGQLPWTETDFFRVVVPPESRSLQRLGPFPPNVRLTIDDAAVTPNLEPFANERGFPRPPGESASAPRILVSLAPGPHKVAVTRAPAATLETTALQFEPMPIHPCSALPSLNESEWTLVRCPMARVGSSNLWKGTLHGSGLKPDRAVRIGFLPQIAVSDIASPTATTLSISWIEPASPPPEAREPPQTRAGGPRKPAQDGLVPPPVKRDTPVEYLFRPRVGINTVLAPTNRETRHSSRIQPDRDGNWVVELTLSPPQETTDALASSLALPSEVEVPLMLAVVPKPSTAERAEEASDFYRRYEALGITNREGQVRLLRQSVALDPRSAVYHNSLAWTLCEIATSRCAEGLPHAREAVRRDPNNEGIQDTLAHAAYAAGEWREAAVAWDNAVKGKYDPAADPLCASDRIAHAAAWQKAKATAVPVAPSRASGRRP